jgi:polyphosphate kinase
MPATWPQDGVQLFSCHQFFMENPSLSGRGTAAKDAPRLIPVKDDDSAGAVAAQ